METEAEISSTDNDNQDVEKSLFDAEQFLVDFANLREECERLKSETQSLHLRVQQLTQELSHAQSEKQELERHIQKETTTQNEMIWNLKIELQKSQEERLSWKEKYLDLCIKSSQNISKDLVDGRLSTNIQKIKSEKQKVSSKKKSLKRKVVMSKPTPDHCETDEKKSKEDNDTSIESQTTNKEKNDNNGVGDTIYDDGEKLSKDPVDQVSRSQIELVATGETDFTSQSENETTVTAEQTATEYYNLPATFDLQTQSQPGSTTSETTFILQTSDATYCATAVLNEKPTTSFGAKNSNADFTAIQPTTDFKSNESESESDDNTEFNFRCGMCNYTYSDQDSLNKHMKAKHTIKTFCCKECGKIYSTKSSLAQHVHHYHRHPNKYKCNVCQKTFHRKDFLIKHEKTHTDVREFQCKHCDKRFKTRASLSGHVNGSHNATRRYVCDYCGMRTSWRLSHLEHMKLHTGEPRNSMKRKRAQMQNQTAEQQIQALSEIQYVTPGTVVQFISAE